jgi:hypothetical protein
MSTARLDPRWKAGLIAASLFALGAVAGVVADRTWTARSVPSAAAAPVTLESMVSALGLDPATRDRLAALLDSLQPEIAAAAAAGPDSLRVATRRAHRRVMEVLPPEQRPAFQRWLDVRHRHMVEMMRHMGPGMMGPGMMGPGMMDSGPPHPPGRPGEMMPGGPPPPGRGDSARPR